jgi:hypothetical protein
MASFNEGSFENRKGVTSSFIDNVPVTVPSVTVTEEHQSEQIVTDTSTAAFLFELAIQNNEGEVGANFKHCILERHEHFHIAGIHPQPTFSFRFGTIYDETAGAGNPRIWAQRHILAKEPYYVISASPFDMDASKNSRSEFFLGKLKGKTSQMYELYAERETCHFNQLQLIIMVSKCIFD